MPEIISSGPTQSPIEWPPGEFSPRCGAVPPVCPCSLMQCVDNFLMPSTPEVDFRYCIAICVTVLVDQVEINSTQILVLFFSVLVLVRVPHPRFVWEMVCMNVK
jgi:hypothetical protein